MDYNENGQISDEELEEKIEQEISAQRERIAMEVWEELKKEDPDMASYIEENYKRLGYTKITETIEPGVTKDFYIVARKSEEQIRKDEERRAKFFNRPDPEEYLESERAKNPNASEDHILEQYVDEFYDLG